MSNLTILGDTSGSVVLQAPAVSGSTTLTLPTTSGTILTNRTAGCVLQVVYAQTTTEVATTSTSYANTGFSASITPSSASNKILIMGSVIVRVPSNNGNYQHNIYRNNTTALAPVAFRGFIQCRGGNYDQTPSFTFLDSPNTTSATTYNWYHKTETGSTAWFAIDNSFAQLTLMEIAG